jgi:hypothetical protein
MINVKAGIFFMELGRAVPETKLIPGWQQDEKKTYMLGF